MGISENHPLRLPPAKPHQGSEIPVGGIVPGRPSVTAVMGMKVVDSCPPASGAKGRLYPAASLPLPSERKAVRPAENGADTVFKVG
jgi:hypothetical protein